MKKNWLFTGMLAMALVFGFALTGCDMDTETPDETPDGKEMNSAIPLTHNTWADGVLAVDGEQWFTFTATAAKQYIHLAVGTMAEVVIRLHDSKYGNMSDRWRLHSGNGIPFGFNIGRMYYIEVHPYGNGASGTYKIAFSTSGTKPVTVTAHY
jgi:hypothetical protein